MNSIIDLAALEKRHNIDMDTVLAMAGAYELRKAKEFGGDMIDKPAAMKQAFQAYLGSRDHETFVVCYLNTRYRIIEMEPIGSGTIDGAVVYPRVVVEKALMKNAAALVIAHNHPSGVSEPSLADQAITRKIKDALALVDIRLLDHLVFVAGGHPVSLAERGLM